MQRVLLHPIRNTAPCPSLYYTSNHESAFVYFPLSFVLFRLKSPNFSYKKWKHLLTNSQDIDLIPVSVPLHEDTQYYRWELDDDNTLLRPLADSIID